MHAAIIWKRDVALIILRCLSREDMHKMQFVCKRWYREKIPIAMKSVPLPHDLLRMKLILMFAKNASTENFTYPPFKLSTLKKYWVLLKTSVPLFDFENIEVEEWNGFSGCYAGMRHKTSAREHGIVSVRRPFGKILESAWIEGRQHGLSRWLKSDGMEVELYSHGNLLASIHYNIDLTERVR